jgi:hypothetical protein
MAKSEGATGLELSMKQLASDYFEHQWQSLVCSLHAQLAGLGGFGSN